MDEAYSLYNLKAEGPIPYSWVEAVVMLFVILVKRRGEKWKRARRKGRKKGSPGLELRDLTLEILHLGGHTPGSSIVYLPQEEILYIGDLLFVKRYPAVIPGIVNTERWIAALERIEGMRIQTVVPGHGPVSTLEQVSRLKGYLRDLRERVGELARRGLRREEILSHPDFPRYAEKAYAASHQRNIGAVYDELFSQPFPS